MKYVITGSLGHISKPVVSALVKAGHEVVVVTSNKDRVKDIESLGATAATGSIDDASFLKQVFTGADAVYTMVPPNFGTPDIKKHIENVGKNYVAAIKGSSVKYIVNLSSIGAHLPTGAGPISGLHHAENALNTLPGVNIKHLRPAYFYNNLLSNVGLIKSMGIMGSNFSVTGNKFPIVDTADIAAVVIEELLQLNFTGQSIRYIASDEVSTENIASAIGAAIGKPDLPWVAFTDEQAKDGMLQAGLPNNIADNYVEMGRTLNNGKIAEEYWKHQPPALGKTKLADFAKVFAAAYKA
jgi:uncharacterized protein YbjT (DUF2867 family)